MTYRAQGNARIAIVLFVLLAAVPLAPFDAAAAGFKSVYSFAGGNDGANPEAGLLIANGNDTTNFLGTTTYGGARDFGTVFEVTPQGVETVLYSFQGDYAGATDGAYPVAGLIKDRSGNLFGTTSQGGELLNCNSLCGTVFKLAPDGTESVLYEFLLGEDAHNPLASLVSDRSGNLYGTTVGGAKGEGTVFKLTPGGEETILYAFNYRRDGIHPAASLIADGSGGFYGTTEASKGEYHHGMVFHLAADGTESVVRTFLGRKNADGATPFANLIADAGGNLYGTTFKGGSDCNCGTVFKLSPDGAETILHNFSGKKHGDGAYPRAGLVLGKDGSLYGTTSEGGADCDCGTVFRLGTDGAESVLHAFIGSDGAYPYAPVTMDKHGNFWGTTNLGGTNDAGTVFKLRP